MQVLNKVITVYAALCTEVKKLKYEVSILPALSSLKQNCYSEVTKSCIVIYKLFLIKQI